MNEKNKLLILLALGLALSSFIGIRLGNDLEFDGFWFVLIPIKAIDVASSSSNTTVLKLCAPGYLFYLLFAINIVKIKTQKLSTKASSNLFLVLTCYTLFIETQFIYNSYLGKYNGGHFHIGVPLFIYGLIVYNKTLNQQKSK